MIEFKPITLEDKKIYESYLLDGRERGCEFSFANLFLWGQQNATILHDHMVLLSHFYGNYLYPYPIGAGDKKPVLDAIIADAAERGIPCRITSLCEDDKTTLEKLYPGRFQFYSNRNNFDYVYSIDDLADLKGRKYHRKRNHLKRFQAVYPEYTLKPLDTETLPKVREMLEVWFQTRQQENPDTDYHLEQTALHKALQHSRELEMEALVLFHEENVLAMTMGSRMSADTFDIHFEKARPDAEGAYPAINYEFARYIRSKYPQIKFLDREDDMGLEGLRKAKESYYPHHMIEKYQAVLLEELDEH